MRAPTSSSHSARDHAPPSPPSPPCHPLLLPPRLAAYGAVLFACLVAALVHDLGHDGFNNAFHINSNSRFAIASCYVAPLEHHHLSSAFSILAQEGSIFAGFGLSQRKQLQVWIRDLVLATDFGVHMDIVNEFRTMLDLKSVISAGDAAGAPPADAKTGAGAAAAAALAAGNSRLSALSLEGGEKVLTMKMVIKTADVGYLSKGHDYCLVWTQRCLDEFSSQGDTEKRLDLPVSFGCDRDTIDVPSFQLGFYNFVIPPLYESMHLLCPIDGQLANLDAMRTHWQAEKEKGQAVKPSE